MTLSLAREDFYDLVWSKPMTHLAREFGLPDVALHNICKKHGIPKPPPGWWTRRRAGKPVKQTPLPPAVRGDGTPIRIVAGELRGESELMSITREKARIAAFGVDSEADAPSHPIIERTAAKLRKAKPAVGSALASVDGAGIIRARIGPASIDRFEQVMNRIAAAAATLGIRLERGERGAVFVRDGEVIGFCVSERARREKHVLTPKEQAEQDEWQRKSDQHRTVRGLRSPSWGDNGCPLPPRIPDWDHHATGQLSFELDPRYYRDASPRKSFRDGKVQRLELLAVEIAVEIAVHAAAMKADRIRRDEDARRHEEELERRAHADRVEHVAKRRCEALDNILDEFAALECLRRVVGELRSADAGSTARGRVETFLAFAEESLAIREAAVSSDGLEQHFERKRLFGDDDDHDFRPSRRYF